ncbi:MULTISPECIES: hypothetical protein [Rhodococcus]|uniref:hypothetical protein n=1 Tax=Rhodococcus TaxID=1827 RepID=UPI0009F69A02|nr:MULTISPECIES: hypothetical protein [Rhodococcus]ORC19967.1 hypothetical protein BXO91_22985 [Rhodococcus qingshengii]
MDQFDEGLRCQDVHAGLRNVNPNSGVLVPLADTQMIGMAASVAALVRGLDVVSDAQALRAVAAEQLDVNPYAFDKVVKSLADVGFLQGVVYDSDRVVRFTETVPFYDDLYARLGEAWRDKKPTDLEQQMVIAVDRLADAPIPVEELASRAGLDSADIPKLIEIGSQSQLIKTIEVSGGLVAYSPFFGFENPALLAELIRDHGPALIADAFAAVGGEQGLPVDATNTVLIDAVSRGLILAPAVELPGGALQPFATLPYSLDPKLLKSRKPVLEKALAVVACLRCGQYFGGYNNLSLSGLIDVIDKLLDPNRGFLQPHSGHERQYRLMHRAGLIAFAPDLRQGGSWVTPMFIDTPDNREALLIARDLLSKGQQIAGRGGGEEARRTLELGLPYTAPMQTLNHMKGKPKVNDKSWQGVVDKALGRGAR